MWPRSGHNLKIVFLQSLSFPKINRIITAVDSQPMFDGGVLINVLGRLQVSAYRFLCPKLICSHDLVDWRRFTSRVRPNVRTETVWGEFFRTAWHFPSSSTWYYLARWQYVFKFCGNAPPLPGILSFCLPWKIHFVLTNQTYQQEMESMTGFLFQDQWTFSVHFFF